MPIRERAISREIVFTARIASRNAAEIQKEAHQRTSLNAAKNQQICPCLLSRLLASNLGFRTRARFRTGEIRVLDSSGNVERAIPFNERTQAGHLRHSRFIRLRDPADVRRTARTKA